jgi:uncharacterized 2Fe-2S/4Fe-4S cluster protein (DUF4445 family)
MFEAQNRHHQVVLLPSGRRGSVAHGTNLLEACRTLGVELESICGGRFTCGKCQVVVEEGTYPKHDLTSAADHLSPPDEAEAAYAAKNALGSRRLACAAEVVGDLLISVPQESQARKQIVAKAATDRPIDVHPAVRQVYVEVLPADLGDDFGDWERLQDALTEQWSLHDLAIDILSLRSLQAALRDPAAQLPSGQRGLTVAVWQEREVVRVLPGYAEGLYGLAVDIGSTTIAAHLCDLRTGAVAASEAMMNPQVRYGEDLMSRVSYGMMELQGVERMHRAALRAVTDLAEKACAQIGQTPECILDAVLVGNTIMIHLLLGIDPVELGGAPFALASAGPVDLRARDLGLAFAPSARVHTLPCIAGHVGADHVGVLLAEAPHQQDEMALVVDVGTNAEMSLGNRTRLVCASSPTGPAFEGAQITHGQRAAAGAIERVRIDAATLEPRYRVIGHEGWIGPSGSGVPASARPTGICGSGIIEAVAQMYLTGILRADGRFADDASQRSQRIRTHGHSAAYVLAEAAQTATGMDLLVTQNDVRAIQLAKGALYAGVKLLMEHLNVERVDRIALAGAFGSYIDPQHAMILGMIPDCDLERVRAVGNAAGDGARIALLNRDQRLEAARLARWVQHVQTATDPGFQQAFVEAMTIPHASDAFPHLEGLLPQATTSEPRHRGRRGSRPG